MHGLQRVHFCAKIVDINHNLTYIYKDSQMHAIHYNNRVYIDFLLAYCII